MSPLSVLRETRGVTLVFVALSLVVLLLFLGLCIDTGWMVYVRSQGQARVDAAALAAVSALDPRKTSTENEEDSQDRADAFASGTVNMVVNTSTNPPNVLIPARYDQVTDTLVTAETADVNWGFHDPNTNPNGCNAVQVTNAIDTPLFFSGVRNFAGASENGSTDINVTATAYLSCPGSLLVSENIELAVRSPTYPGDCDALFQVSAPSGENSLTFIQLVSPGTTLTVGEGVVRQSGTAEDLNRLRGRYPGCNRTRCDQEPADSSCTALLPVINGSDTVEGFAKICFSNVEPQPEGEPQYVEGLLECGELGANTGSGGQCFGTYAQNYILVQ